MKQEHVVNVQEVPAEIEVSVTADKMKVSLIRVVNRIIEREANEDGEVPNPKYEVHFSQDASPHKAEYGDVIEAIVALRYTTGAEIALNRLPDDDAEKVAYLAFVDKAKMAAKVALGLDME